ncbi:uncharacterized protein LOC131222633 isoform X2 [Magnolia sinica]|uniref:uncharacterized protein LOC131222633 isoform X2 n=1 Tax=Magnolia sinica TaxID=86752 RepID=UPI002658FDD8|nr:uncharacterized protein LOC131222633 isoform X2 [Magnolia sinica]
MAPSMKKDSSEMDLEEWEFLPDSGYLDFPHRNGKKGFDPKGADDLDYFICPSLLSPSGIEKSENSSLLGNGNQPVSMVEKNPYPELVKDIGEVPLVKIGTLSSPTVSPKLAADQDMISQVFFKKAKENEFVDMKMDSPRSSNRSLKPQIEVGPFQFEEKEEAHEGDGVEENKPSKEVTEQENGKNYMGSEIKERGCWEGCGFNIWKWRVTGIGAICSIGMAAATICVLILGSNQRHKQHENQKLQFQIYADNKIEPGDFSCKSPSD